MNDVNVKIT